MRRMLLTWLVVSLTALFQGPCASGGTEPIVTTDLLRLRTVGEIDVAADGSKAVYSVRSMHMTPATDGETRPTYGYRDHLYLLDLTDRAAQPVQLTFGDRRDRDPHLSRDGRHVVFVREAEVDGETRPQVWLMSLMGGEARQLTEMPHGAARPRWSPDDLAVMVTAPVPAGDLDGAPPWPAERPQRAWGDTEGVDPAPDGTRAQIRAWLQQNAGEEDPNVINRLSFQGEQSLRGAMRFDHLFLVDIARDGASPRQITSGFFDHEDAEFMPDGRQIIYAAKKPTDVHPDRELAYALWRIDTDGTNDVRVLGPEGWSVRSPQPSIDGSIIAFTGHQLDQPSYRPRQLGIVTASQEEPDFTWLTEAPLFKSTVYSYRWAHARSALVFTTPWEGAFPLMMASPGMLEPAPVVEEIGGRPVGVHAFDVGGPVTVMAATTVAAPCQLMVMDGFGLRRAVDLNPWVADKLIVEPEMNWVTRPDGTRVQYWLMEPAARTPGETYPLCLEIHGGPSAMWGPGERTMWLEFQLLCSWGYGVVYANPRGSGGYGYEFQRANYQDWGEGPAGDVLAAVDRALLAEWVDPDRLVVTGGSYGGYLTAWVVSQDHRFKAAVAQRGVYDLATFFGEGNAWRLVPWHMGGMPHDARFRTVIRRNSPLTYADRIRTPLLILHASQDLRTGVSQSEMLYRALKTQQRPVEYVRYPAAGHDLSRSGDPLHRLDRLNRIIEFFERHIENPRPAPTASSADGS